MKAWARVRLVTIAVLAGPGAGPAVAAGTVQFTEGSAFVEADTFVHCPPGSADHDDERVGTVTDFEASVTASSEEDCGVQTSASARQRTRVSGGGASLTITSTGSAFGEGSGESNEDGDQETEQFNGNSRVSFGFRVVGEPVEFSMSGTHSGLRPAGSFSQGVVGDPRPGNPNLPEGFALSGVLPPGDYNVRAQAQCTNLPSGSATCPDASYSLTAVIGGEADDDGDALPDIWEENGVDTDGDEIVDLDLPAMGADPLHKDVFLEIDFMPPHALEPSAIDAVVQSFDDAPVTNPDGTTGIALHVDNGHGSVMNPRTGATWGARSRQDALAHVDVLGLDVGPDYQWAQFDALKNARLDQQRRPVFHYAISGHNFASRRNGRAASRGTSARATSWSRSGRSACGPPGRTARSARRSRRAP